MLEWLNELVDDGGLDRARILPLEISGLSTDRGKVFFWRRELLPLPLSYLADTNLRDKLREALGMAERVGQLFRTGFDTFTRAGTKQIVPRPMHLLGAALASASDDRKPPENAVRQIIDHLAPGRAYWSRLDTPFSRFLVDLVGDRVKDEDGDWGYGATVLPVWTRDVVRAARDAFKETTSSLDTSARELKAVAQAQREFNRRLVAVVKSDGNREQMEKRGEVLA